MLLVDPAALDRFAASAVGWLGTAPVDEDGEPVDRGELAGQLRALLERLSTREQAVVSMHLARLRQREIAAMLGIGQPTVSYALRRARAKIALLRGWEGATLTAREVRADLDTYFGAGDIEVLVSIWETTCVSETARRLQTPQRDVHRLLTRAVARMGTYEGLARMRRVFGWLAEHGHVSHYRRRRRANTSIKGDGRG